MGRPKLSMAMACHGRGAWADHQRLSTALRLEEPRHRTQRQPGARLQGGCDARGAGGIHIAHLAEIWDRYMLNVRKDLSNGRGVWYDVIYDIWYMIIMIRYDIPLMMAEDAATNHQTQCSLMGQGPKCHEKIAGLLALKTWTHTCDVWSICKSLKTAVQLPSTSVLHSSL